MFVFTGGAQSEMAIANQHTNTYAGTNPCSIHVY